MLRRVDHHGGGPEKELIYRGIQSILPAFVRKYVLHFDAAIEHAAAAFAASLPPGARVLDAGAGECNYKPMFHRQRYTGIDLGIGDTAWDYAKIDAVADLTAVPFPAATFDAVVNIVTLEHVREPAVVIAELARVLKPGGRLLLIVPLEWEEHQQPHDYFRYTRYGLRYLLERAGMQADIRPVGGFFRLMSRRMFNALQFFPGPLFFLAAIFFVPPALILPLLDPLDRKQAFTLGFICQATKIP